MSKGFFTFCKLMSDLILCHVIVPNLRNVHKTVREYASFGRRSDVMVSLFS